MIGEVGSTVREIDQASASIAATVSQQQVATHEIAANVAVAATGTQLVSDNIAAVGQEANQAGSAAEMVVATAQAMTRHSAELKDSVGRFLTRSGRLSWRVATPKRPFFSYLENQSRDIKLALTSKGCRRFFAFNSKQNRPTSADQGGPRR